MGKRITAVLLATIAASAIACGTAGAKAGQQQAPEGNAVLDPGIVDSNGAQGSLVAPIDGPYLQP